MKRVKIFKLDNQKSKLLIQIFKFIIVGGIATMIDWIIYYILYHYVKLEPLIANIISYSISTLYNYVASVKYVFNVNKEKSKHQTFIIFIILCIIGLLLSESLIYLMIKILKINKMLAKIISTIIIMVFNFVTRKKMLEKD